MYKLNRVTLMSTKFAFQNELSSPVPSLFQQASKKHAMTEPCAPIENTPTPARSDTRRVVDAFTRTLHALLALCFVGAYITAESETYRFLHVSLGYTLGGLWVARLLWGFWGPRPARWSALWRKLGGLGDWMRAAGQGQWAWRQAQNLYIGLTVAGVLLVIVPVVMSGYVTDQEWTGDWMEEVHEFFGNALLMAVLAHILGVLLLSAMRRRNLAAPMLTGRVAGIGPDLIRSNHGGLAVLLVSAVLFFGFWRWQEAPTHPANTAQVGSVPGLAKAQWASDDD